MGISKICSPAFSLLLICVSFLLFFFHLYYYIIFLTFGEKKHFFLFLHFISLCLNFSSKILLYISSFFLSFKKIGINSILHTMCYCSLYYYIIISKKIELFVFVFSSQKKLEQTDHRY